MPTEVQIPPQAAPTEGTGGGAPAAIRPRRARSRKTRASVRVADRVARTLISIGGMGTIFAVSLVCVFLVWVVVPLFAGGRIEPAGVVEAGVKGEARALHLVVNEYRTLGWEVFDDGTMAVFRADTGEVLRTERVVDPAEVTAWSFAPRGGDVALGFRDGTVRMGRIRFTSTFRDEATVPEELRRLGVGEVAAYGEGLMERSPAGQFRTQTVEVTLEDPIQVGSGAGVLLLDMSVRPSGPTLAALTEDGKLHVKQVTQRRNMMTGKTTATLSGGEMAIPLMDGRDVPRHLLLSGVGDTVYLAWGDGYTARFDTRNVGRLELAETLDLVPEAGEGLTAVRFMIGKTSLIAGDSLGRVRTWFRTRPAGAKTPDGSMLVMAHELPAGFEGERGPRVTALASSGKSRMVTAGYEDGTVRLFQVTAGRLLGVGRAEGAGEGGRGGAVTALAMAPKDDEIFGAVGPGLARWRIHAEHPETTLASMFRPVWYEGYNAPAHVWQSSSGTDEFEPKYGLMPLIFGTLKATVYSMIFGVPLALLAAVYTSEFLNPKARARIKPSIEMMASLPSVVLGFLAALVIAPFVAGVVPELLATFAAVPFVFVLGAYLWQLLPSHRAVRWARYRFGLMVAAVPLGVGLGFAVGPAAEGVLFAGDIKAWLDGQVGSGAGGWFMLLLPASAVAVALGIGRVVRPRLRGVTAGWTRTRAAVLELGLFLAGAAATVGLGLAASHLLAMGWDPRGTFVDTYVQRNALIVGFVMGFAIIPIIYTISEDAMSAVPDHLRSASLGAGATPWQTAVRVIIPTAMSGLFSAVMIGFGRAVGETMIVLMAAGNTPVMEWNIFNGFRTLSANIAVELPEAVQGDTHYRMLFLAALTLFAMTFAVNTVAEVVRQRFRKRAFQL